LTTAGLFLNTWQITAQCQESVCKLRIQGMDEAKNKVH
jgi:hypothetical protein